MLTRYRFGVSGGAVSRTSSNRECWRKYTHAVNITPIPRLARMAAACAPGRYRFAIPWRMAAERRSAGWAAMRRMTYSSNALIALKTRRLPRRMPPNTEAYLTDDATQIAIAHNPAMITAVAMRLRMSRPAPLSSETSRRRMSAGLTDAIERSAGRANRIAVTTAAATPFSMAFHGHIKMTAISK